MSPPVTHRTILLVIAASVIGCVAAARAAVATVAGGSSRAAVPAASPYTPAQRCGSCHQAIFKSWSTSAHARSASGPAYLAAARAAAGAALDRAAAERECAWCHAPTTLLSGDYGLKQAISREGITCDFCHTVAGVDLDKQDHPFDLKPGKVKRGPLQYAKSPFHETEYSSLHRASPLLCAACHEYRNARGVAVLSTYSEWKAGPYPARGVPCQECHMALVPGSTVREDLKGQTLRVVNLHRLVGGGGMGQVRRGIDLRIDSLSRSGGTAQVTVVVTNSAAGHAVPGGLSTKSLILAVGVEAPSGSFQGRQERVYRRQLKDADGRVLETVVDLFQKAATVGEDSRLKPGESRTERFDLPLPEGAKAVVARLEYRDASDPQAGPKTSVVTEVRRDLSAR